MNRSTVMPSQVALVGGARTEEARVRGRRRFVFALSEDPSEEWKALFALACERSLDKRWAPAEIWIGELAIEILLDDREHVQAYLAERFKEANEWFDLGGAPRY